MEAETVVKRIFDEMVNKGNLDVVDELFTEDCVDHGATGDLHGREALREAVGTWLAAVPDAHCTVEQVISEGDLAAWLVRTTGTHTGDALGFPATNKRYETVHPEFGRLRDGKAAEHWSEQGMISMLTQIGIMPAPGG